MKKIYFLSGLPRSGSTLLGSILTQNPEITVTPTSPLLDLLCFTNESFDKLSANYTFDKESFSNEAYKALINVYFNQFKTPVVFDKHRGWPKNMIPAKMFITENPKIICTYRSISEIITSYIVLIEKNKNKPNFVDDDLKKLNIPITTENRAKILWKNYISDPYQSTIYGIENFKKNMFFVSYNDLIYNTSKTLEEIYSFVNLPKYKNHNFENITNFCAEEKDSAWGIDGLHEIRKKLEKTSANTNDVLGSYLSNYYNDFNLKFN